MAEPRVSPKSKPVNESSETETERLNRSRSGSGPIASQKRNAMSKLSKVTGKKSDQPTPWPMPPRRYAQGEEPARSQPNTNNEKEAYLTPQSSFNAENGLQRQMASSDYEEERSRSLSTQVSKDNSEQHVSFSSDASRTSSKLAELDELKSFESFGGENIEDEDIDHFLAEDMQGSQPGLDILHLFADEDQNDETTENTASISEQSSISKADLTNSSTPKARRAPFQSKRRMESGENRAILAQALKFVEENGISGRKSHERAEKAIPRTENPALLIQTTQHEYDHSTKNSLDLSSNTTNNVVQNAKTGNISGNRPLQSQLREEEELDLSDSLQKASLQSEKTNRAQASGKSGVRRPLASKRTKVQIAQPMDLDASQSLPHETSSQRASSLKELKQVESVVAESTSNHAARPKQGVIMRAQTHVSHVAGIRRAEAGRIMSRAELRSQKAFAFQESPNPKSLHLASFHSEEEDVTAHRKASLSSSQSADGQNQIEHQENIPKRQDPVTHCSNTDDGSFLSPGILSRKKKFGAEDYRVDSFQVSDHEESSGLLNRFSSGVRKAALAVGKKSSHEVAPKSRSGIVVSGTVDEAVCKISVVCRKRLNCEVHVKENGRKIKVESRSNEKSKYLRATILIRLVANESSTCEIIVRQSRSDGMKTSLAALWAFHERLEEGLKDYG